MKRLLLAGAVLMLPTPLIAGVMIDLAAFCTSKDRMLDDLQPAVTGGEILAHAQNNGNNVNFYLNEETRGWAMIFFPPGGDLACVIYGEGFTPGAPPEAVEGDDT